MADYMLVAKQPRKVTETIICYTVPLYIVVTQEEGFRPFISKVVVDDEADLIRSEEMRPCDGNGNELPLDDPDVQQAITLIENGQSEWPAWRFGS